MPIDHRFFPDSGGIVSAHIGIVDDQEFLASYRRLFGMDEFEPSYGMVVDLRDTDSTPRSADALRDMAAMFEQTYKNALTTARVAVIAPTNLSFGLGRMYQSFADSVPGEFAVFRAADAALAWLRVPEEILSIGAAKRAPLPGRPPSPKRDTP